MKRTLTLLVMAIALGLGFAFVPDGGGSVVEAQKRRRPVTNMKDLKEALAKKDSSDADRLMFIVGIPPIEDPAVARGIGVVYTDWIEKNPAGTVSAALLDRLRGISHESTLIELRDDVRDATNVDVDLRVVWLQANASLKTEDCSKFLHELLKDAVPTIRMLAIEALGARLYEPAWIDITKALSDVASWKVRLAAIQAVENFGVKQRARYLQGAVDALMDSLNREKGRLQQDIMAALKSVSKEDYGEDREAWWAWYRSFRKDGGGKAEDGEVKPRRYSNYGVDTFSLQIIFVIDTSTSMRDPVDPKVVEDLRRPITGKDREPEPEDPDIDWNNVKTRLDLARVEMIRTIRKLPEEAHFTIITYDDQPTVWKPGLVQATKATKDEAIKMLKSLKTRNLTNIYGAFDEVFKLAENAAKEAEVEEKKKPRATGKGGGGTREKPKDIRVPDTVYFMTDGMATAGEYRGPDGVVGAATPEQAKQYDERMREMVKKIWERNQTAKLRINTVGIGPDHDRRTLPLIARQNSGTYVSIGDPRDNRKK